MTPLTTVTVTYTPVSLNELGDRALANSRRWFPDLHAGDIRAAAAHFAMGLFGEVAELLEHPDDPLEVADVFTYALDLGRVLGCDLDAALAVSVQRPLAAEWSQEIVISAGLAVNQFKKVNRGDVTLHEAQPQIASHLARLIYLCWNYDRRHGRINGRDLVSLFEEKEAICEQRWGAGS